MLKEIEKALALKIIEINLLIPFSAGGEVNFLRNNAKIISEEYTNDGTLLKVIIPTDYADRFQKYVIEKDDEN